MRKTFYFVHRQSFPYKGKAQECIHGPFATLRHANQFSDAAPNGHYTIFKAKLGQGKPLFCWQAKAIPEPIELKRLPTAS